MNVRTALLAALFLSGCQSLDHQVDRTITAIEPLKSDKVKKKTHRKYASGLLADERNVQDPTDSDNLWGRISNNMQLEFADNYRISEQRDWLLRNENHFATIANRAEPYLYLIVEEIERRGLPMELVTVPMIESTFDPHARSQSNAVGLWQFIPTTGRSYGLRHDNWYDGRRDVLASTRAALDYLEYLNRFFDGDWLQALAAYNAGEGRVRSAIERNQRAGLATDYWALDLPRETQMYVPKILAMADMISKADQYNVHLPQLANKPQLRVVETGGRVDLSVAAELAGLRTAQLKEVNPALSKGVMSPNGPYRLLVPVEYADTLELALAELPASERMHNSTPSFDTVPASSESHLAKAPTTNSSKTRTQASSSPRRANQTASTRASKESKALAQQAVVAKKSSYHVRAGDTWWSVSQAHGVSQQDLIKWNGLSAKATLKTGMKLVVYPKKGGKTNKSMVYQVRRGDSLTSIAARFQVAINDVRRWNQLDKGENLKLGQELTLFVKNNS